MCGVCGLVEFLSDSRDEFCCCGCHITNGLEVARPGHSTFCHPAIWPVHDHLPPQPVWTHSTMYVYNIHYTCIIKMGCFNVSGVTVHGPLAHMNSEAYSSWFVYVRMLIANLTDTVHRLGRPIYFEHSANCTQHYVQLYSTLCTQCKCM